MIFRKYLFNLKIKYDILFIKIIPWRIKRRLFKYISYQIPLFNIKYSKGLFCHSIYEKSYDVFISSILAYKYNNYFSLAILNRSQIESLLLTEYLLYKPNEISEIFSDKMFKKSLNYKGYEDPFILKLQDKHRKYYSNIAHPSPIRHLKNITFNKFLKPKKNNVNINILFSKKYKAMSKNDKTKILNKMFSFNGYSPSVHSHTYTSDSIIENELKISIEIYHNLYNRIFKINKYGNSIILTDDELEIIKNKHKKF